MPTRADICAEALTWEGTPYHAQACLKGVGVDCAMLLVGIARGCGCIPPTWTPAPYSPEWHCHQKEEQLAQTIAMLGGQMVFDSPQPGDIVTFRMRQHEPVSHTGILLPGGYVLHALCGRAVLRHRLAGIWASRLIWAYAFPGVTV